MPDETADRPQAHAFWSGTFSFGLVSVPVEMYAAVRSRRVSLRMLGPNGHPLTRRYVCSLDGEALEGPDLVRGYPIDGDEHVVVTDEELEALAPEKSRDIDLRRFVDRAEIDPRLLERPYILAPSGDSTKAYHLLAEMMEKTGRAGIATFVMRGREYLIAVFAERGLLRGATMRFIDELRTAEDVGLSEANAPSRKRVKAMKSALDKLARDTLDESLLRDDDDQRLRELAERKRAASQDVIEVPEGLAEDADGDANVVDIMALLKQRVGAKDGANEDGGAKRGGKAKRAGKRSGGERPERLAELTKQGLYERAKSLGISGRSQMSKDELIEAIRKS